MSGALIFVVALVVVALVLVFAGVKTVSQGTNWTIERFGRYTRTLPPGLHLIVPFMDRVGRKMNMQENVLDIPPQKVITKDNASVQVDAVAFYQVIDAARAAYEVQNLHLAITNLALTNIRSVMGNMALDEALSKRNDINNTLLAVIDQATGPWGVKVLRIEVKDIAPPEDIVVAMGRQMKAEREKRATILEAEGVRESSIQRAEGEKQSAILTAEGRREAAFRDAEARERLAQAEAKATAVVAEAIAGNGVQATNYFLGTKYVEALVEDGLEPQRQGLLPAGRGGRHHGLDRRHRRAGQGGAGARRGGRGGAAARLGSQHRLSAMMSFKIIFWYWWALAAVLLVFEMMLPGIVFLFLSIGALASGAFLLVVSDLSLELQLVVFAIVSVASAVLLRPALRRLQQRPPRRCQSQRPRRQHGRQDDRARHADPGGPGPGEAGRRKLDRDRPRHGGRQPGSRGRGQRQRTQGRARALAGLATSACRPSSSSPGAPPGPYRRPWPGRARAPARQRPFARS